MDQPTPAPSPWLPARVLADVAEKTNEIDAKRAVAALKRAEERLSNPATELDVGRALNALKRAQARLAAADTKE